METVENVVNDALTELMVQQSEQQIEASEMQTAIRYLNRMMAEWDAEGYSLGYTIVTNPSDNVTVPAGAISAIVTNLALRLSAQFLDVQVPSSLIISAQAGKRAIAKIAVSVGAADYPAILPIGSGNEWDYETNHFYPETADQALDESGGNILLES